MEKKIWKFKNKLYAFRRKYVVYQSMHYQRSQNLNETSTNVFDKHVMQLN